MKNASLPRHAVDFVKDLLTTGIFPENLPTNHHGLINTFGPLPAINAVMYNTMGYGRGGHTRGGVELYTPRMIGCPLPTCEAKPLEVSIQTRARDHIETTSMDIMDFLSRRVNRVYVDNQPAITEGQTCSVLYTSSKQLQIPHTMLGHMSNFDLEKRKNRNECWDAHSIHYNVVIKILDQLFIYVLMSQSVDMIPIREVYIPVWIDPLEPEIEDKRRFMLRFFYTSKGKYSVQYIEDYEHHPIPTESTYIILANIPWWNTPRPHGD